MHTNRIWDINRNEVNTTKIGWNELDETVIVGHKCQTRDGHVNMWSRLVQL
jgi:hypothetical protein